MFSLTNSFKHTLTKPQNAVYNYDDYGPTFGGGHDWHVKADMNTGSCNLGNSYGCRSGLINPACQNDFCGSYNGWTIDAFEVFVLKA